MSGPSQAQLPEGVGLKLARAKEHLATLDNEIRAYLDSKPYRVSCDREANGIELVYRVHIDRSPPLSWSAIIGDCLQNMRGALEHLAWVLVESGGGTPGRGTSFPIFTKDPFAPGADKRSRKIFEGHTKGMPGGAVALIKQLQPYMAPDVAGHPLYILNELARVDRHQVLHVVGATNNAIAITPNREVESAGTHWIPVPGVDFRDEINFGPFEDGAIIARFIFFPNMAPPEMVMNSDFAFVITFSDSRESGPAARWLVVETLSGLFENIGGFVVPELTKFL